jgi:hypothetical protein
MKRKPRNAPLDDTFLPSSIVSAADRAMQEVLDEDRLLREFGIQPRNGRSR